MKMEFQILIASTLLILVLINCVISLYQRRKLPPGPIGLPIFGNLFQIGPNPHESFTKLAKKHGPLMTIRLGSVTTIVASSPEMAMQILKKKDEVFSGRVVPDAVTGPGPKGYDHEYAMPWLPAGERWRVLRRALNNYLTQPQKLDMLQGLRYKVVEQMVDYVREISEKGGSCAVDIGKLAFTTAVNQMSNTCFSVSLADFRTHEINGLQNAIKTIMEVDGKPNIADCFPFLKVFDPQGIRKRAKEAYGLLDQLIENCIAKRLGHRAANLARYGDLLDSLLDFGQESGVDFTLHTLKILLMVSALSPSLSQHYLTL